MVVKVATLTIFGCCKEVSGEEMVARVEDCFLGREQGFGLSKFSWKWSQGSNQVAQCLRDGDVQHSNSFYDASRSGDLPTWSSNPSGMQGFTKGLHNVHYGVQPHHFLNATVVPESDQNDSVLNSNHGSSYVAARNQVANAITLAPGRAGVNSLAPGLARNPSFESINNTGSCSTPSFGVGSPETVFPAHPSDLGSRDSSDMMLRNRDQLTVGAYPESKVQPQLSDSQSNDSLSYGSQDAIVNCVDDFWSPQEAIDAVLPDFRLEAMPDEISDTGACGLSFSDGQLGSLVSTHHGHSTGDTGPYNYFRRGSELAASLSTMAHAAPAPDFCQSFLVGGVDDSENPMIGNSVNLSTRPSQLSIPPKLSSQAVFNGSPDHPGRLCWSHQPWSSSQHTSGSGSLDYIKQHNITSPTSLAGSSPSSPTTPLDQHLFASSTLQGTSPVGNISSVLKADEIQKKLAELIGANSNKRSFSAMLGTCAAGTAYGGSSASGGKETSLSLPSLGQGGANTDKFDAAALSALLYSNSPADQDFRSNFASPPAPKQRRRHGTATDPQSIAARTRREKFTDRIRILQSLVPNGERLDTVHMLSQTFEYVRFLQHKVWDLYNNKDSISEVKCEKWKEFVDATTGQVIV